MTANTIIEKMTAKVKTVLQNHADCLDRPLMAENAEQVAKVITEAITLMPSQEAHYLLEKYSLYNVTESSFKKTSHMPDHRRAKPKLFERCGRKKRCSAILI
jgi:hypothetical protein